MRKILLLTALLVCAFITRAQHVDEKDQSIAMQLVNANRAKLGLSSEDISNLSVQSSYIIQGSDIRMAYMQQTWKGIPVYNKMLVLAFRNGALVSNAGELAEAMESKTSNHPGMPVVKVNEGLRTALVDRKVSFSSLTDPIEQPGSKRLVYGKLGIAHENITAELMWMPSAEAKQYHLAWQYFIAPNKSSDYWLVRVNADNNTVTSIENLTVYCSWENKGHSADEHYRDHAGLTTANEIAKVVTNNFVDKQKAGKNTFDWQYRPFVVNSGTYRVVRYPAESPLHPGGTPTTHTNPWTWAPGNATTLKWHDDGVADANDTKGNNVLAAEDLDGNNTPGLLAVSTTALPDLTFNFTPDFTQPPTQTTPVPNQQFNITNLFYWNNLMHDLTYLYGFDEPSGNFQQTNLGRGGLGNDRVNADAQNPGNCNANFATPVDGTSGRMQMFLCTNTTPPRDGDADNMVIAHEYGHGISNRLTGGPGNSSCLGNSEQMGEGWSDYFGLMYTADWATATPSDGFNNPRGVGTYLFGEPPSGPGIRPTRYSTNFAVNPTTYANLPVQAIPHGVGYVWCTMLWEMTWEIIQTAGINPNLFQVTPSITGGNNIALKLVVEGMRLQPCSPGFVQGRDAILRADTLFFGAQYSCAIIRAFARRGLGLGASQGSSASITDGVPSFNGGGPTHTITSNVTQQQQLNDIIYTQNITANCEAIANYTLTDTLPAHVTFVSATAGGTYNAGNRVVSWNPVNIAVNATNQYQFTVNINNGAYFPPVDHINDPVLVSPIPATWTAATNNGASNWAVSATQSASAPNSYFVNNVATVADVTLTSTNQFLLPGGASAYNELRFTHRIMSENTFDGGVVEISTNNGASWSDLGPYITQNGYNGTISTCCLNPIGGRPAFTGTAAGFTTTIINLNAFGGQTVKIRFRFGSDNSIAATGWFVDDILMTSKAVVIMKSNLYNAGNVLQTTATNIVEIIGACVAPVINTQPQTNILCNNGNAVFSVGATGSGLTYQWELSTDNGANWNPIPGATSNTYGITGATSALNGRLYRCQITGTCGNATSASASIYVSSALTHSGVAFTPSTVCVPNPSTVTGTASGGTVSDIVVGSTGTVNIAIPDNNATGVNIPVTVPALSFNSASNLKVRLTTTNGHTWVGDLIISLTSPCGNSFVIHRPGVPQSGVGNSADFNGTFTFDVNAAAIVPETGGGVIAPGSYQPSNNANPGVAHQWSGITFPCAGAGTWTMNISDNAGGDIGTLVSWELLVGGGYSHTLTGPGTIVQNASSGANNQTGSFTVTNAPVGVNNYTFTSRDALGCSVSTVVTLTTSAPPVITVQPVARVICQGASTTFNITATGLALTYQWQLSTNIGATWNNIPGATANSTAVSGAVLSQSGHQYRCIVTSACGSTTSNAVTLTVTPNPIHQSLSATPNPVCAPGPIALTGTAVGGTLAVGGDIVLATSGVINLAIPDSPNPAVTNNLTVPAFSFASASELKVRINIAHTWVGDISVRLTTPCGSTIIFDRPGVPATGLGNSADLSGVYVFDLGAATIIPETLGSSPIPAGSYRPSDVGGAAHNWAGMTFPCSAAGTWTITLQDFAGGDIGTLTEWAILGPSAVGTYSHSMTGPGTLVQNPSTGGPSNPTANFTASNLPAGAQVYNLTTTDSRGCSVTSPINVTVNPRPNPVIVSPNMAPQTVTFTSTGGAISIPSSGAATPYPSIITTSGLPATATVASVTLNGVSHTFPSDIDILLQSPNGTNVVLMSDAGSGTDISNVNYTFMDGAPAMTLTVNPSGTYRPFNSGATDTWVAPGPGSVTQAAPALSLFTPGLVPNGGWRLFVVDDLVGDLGSITSWSITFSYPSIDLCAGSSTQLAILDTTRTLTSTVPIAIPTQGNGNPYPGTLSVSGLPTYAKVRSVSLNGLSHTTIGDIDVMLQSPNGTNVILMSDIGGNNPVVNVNYTFQDGFPQLAAVASPSGTYSPTNLAGPDDFPAPGPGVFTQINPRIDLFNTSSLTVNGTWNLYAVDLNAGDAGSITSWSITFEVPGATLVTYTWSPATGLSSTTGNPVTASPTVTTTYSVSAVSSFGCTSAAPVTIPVNVLALPAITVQPTPATQTICPGYNVSYSVTATGAGLTYQWRKNGVNMVNGGNISGATSATLTLTAVTAADAATYTVVVSGTCPPAVTSNGAVLQIGTLPTITTQPPAATSVCERQSATISVTATALPPIQIYQWQVSTDGVNYTNLANSAAGASPFYNNVFSNVLTIANAPLSINGNRYRCVITTNCGFVITSNASQLTVNPTPVVTATPVTSRVCISDTLVLLSGTPAGGVWSGPGVVPGTNRFIPFNTAVGTFPVKYKVTNQPSGCADSAIISIKVEECPERIRLLSNDGVLLYPNPNNGQFNIRVNSTLYNYLGMKVFTSAGALVKHQRWTNLPYGRVIPIDIRDLAAAVYIVYVYYEDGVRTSEKSFKVIIPSH